MRADLPQLLVERPRLGRGSAVVYRRAHRREVNDARFFDDAATHESSRRHYKDRKQLNENFAPLLRFLRSNVGRRWDDVYSEMRACLRVTKAVDLHVTQHIDDFLFTTTWRGADGHLRAHTSSGPDLLNTSHGWRGSFYVCPKGFLREKKEARKKKHKPRSDVKVVDGRVAVRKQDARGCYWVELDMQRFPLNAGFGFRPWTAQGGFAASPVDAFFGKETHLVTGREAAAVYGSTLRYAAGIKASLGQRGLKFFGLK